MAVENFDQVTIAPAKLRPFSKFIMSIGELPTSYLDSLSYAEQVTWFCDYLQNNVIPALNNNAEALAEVQTLMTQLQEYVDNYFTNLDVQEEINNKLDEMARNGSLTRLIKSYVDPIYEEFENRVDVKLLEQDSDIQTLNTTLTEQVSTLSNRIDSVASGSPAGIYATVSDLETADPDHDNIYLVLANGKWYYYNTSTTSWTEGGTYQSTGIGESTINYIDFDNITSSLYGNKVPSVTYTDSKKINHTGTVSDNSGYKYTSDISLLKGETLIVYTSGSSGSTSIICEHVDSTFIPIVITDTGDPKYYYFTAYKDMTVVVCGQKSTFEKLKILTIKNDNISNQLFNLITIINQSTSINGYISYQTGLNASHTDYVCSDFIEILPNTNIKITAFNNLVNSAGLSGLAFYDTSKSYISGLQYPAGTSLTGTVPANAKYIRYTKRKTCYNFKIEYTNLLIPIYNLSKKITEEKMSNFFDLSLFPIIGVVGDSYASGCFGEQAGAQTAPEHYSMSWPSMLQRQYGFELHNFSKGGQSTRSFISEGKLTQLTNTEKCDLYLLVLERNDYNIEDRGESGYIGSIDDIEDYSLGTYPNTFYGNYATIIETIQNYNSNAKIIMITGDYVSTNSLGTAYNEAMKTIAGHYNIPYMEELANPYFASDLYRLTVNRPAGGHPGAIQYNGMATAINEMFDTCVKDNFSYFIYTNPADND